MNVSDLHLSIVSDLHLSSCSTTVQLKLSELLHPFFQQLYLVLQCCVLVVLGKSQAFITGPRQRKQSLSHLLYDKLAVELPVEGLVRVRFHEVYVQEGEFLPCGVVVKPVECVLVGQR